MTRNVTLRMDERLLRELRHRAVDANMSLSAWITSVLEEQAHGRGEFEQARRRSLERLKEGFPLGGTPLGRDDAHGR